MTPALSVLAWNVHSGNPGAQDAIDYLIGAHRPDVVVLTECQYLHSELPALAAQAGYQLVREQTPWSWHQEPLDERGDTVVLLGPQVELRKNQVVPMRQRWIAPVHDKEHTPRRYPVLRLRAYGRRWRLCAAHWPTGFAHDKNTSAVDETLRWSRRLLRRTVWTPTAIVGDLNLGASSLRILFPRHSVVGRGPDNLIAAKAGAVSATSLPKFGSDHHAILYRLEAP